MSIATVPAIFYEFGFNADPNQNVVPPWWSDLSSRVQYGWSLTRGRQYELDTNEAGVWRVELANTDGALDPGNASSPYAPILPYRPARIRVVLGNNLLTPDVASAGELSPWNPGPLPALSKISSAFSIGIASVGASAYQGTQVYAVQVPGGASIPSDLLAAPVQQVTAGATYTFSAQVQAVTSGQNIVVQFIINWLGTAGQTLAISSGSTTPLTGGTGTWTAVSVTGTAPAAAVAATVRVTLTSAAPAANTVWIDGLQLEARGYATRWQIPWAPGVNLLPRNIATGTETMAVTDTPASWFYPTVGSVAQAQNLTAAPTGATTAASWTLPAGSTSAASALYAGVNAGSPTGPVGDCAQVVAGQSYTASAYLLRAASADATVQATVAIAWFTSAGVVLSTSIGAAVTLSTSAWGRATVTASAPATAAWGRMQVKLASPATTTAQNVIYGTSWQVEQAAAATVWADPGPATFLFTGLVERFPRTWSDLSSTYGTSRLQCVDITAALSQLPLGQPFVQEVLALGPNFFYQLADAAGSTACADSAARRVPAPVENSPFGAGSLVFGSSITSTSPTAGFVGTPGPVATFANNPSNNPPIQYPETFISLHKTSATPGPPSNSAWTRMIAFRSAAPPGTSNFYGLWVAVPAPYNSSNQSEFEIAINPTGYADLRVQDSTGAAGAYTGSTSLCDGNWHLIAVGSDPTAGTVEMWIDNVLVGSFGGVSASSSFATDTLGAAAEFGANLYADGFIGDMALAAEFPFLFTTAQMATLYNSWRTASSGESSGARYARVLQWIGWTGPTSIASGSTQSMGPASDMVGLAPVDALNTIAATENGDSFVSAAGVLTFTGRSALYGVRTPQVVFGEGLPAGNAGEWPCEVGSLDFDPAHLANVTQITEYQGSVYTGVDATSVRRFFSRLYQRTINTTSGAEAQDAANYLISQLKDPKQRANIIRLHPSAMLGLFPVVAQIDKNTRIRLMKRPTGAPSTQLDAFVQRIAWTCSPESDFFVEFQASPADLENYWRVAGLHTTLNTQASSGQNLAVINALSDAAVNRLAQSMPTSQVLWFEPGTPRFEAVTVQTVPSTSLGYTTATLTMAGNFVFTHPANSVVCEPLQTGVTDPTSSDASSVLGASYAPILSGGAAGTNTVTVGPLADSSRNALGQNWSTGDTVVLSSGASAIVEAAVIQSVSPTYPGYTSCTLTFTTNLVYSHPATDYVSDQYVIGNTNPSTFAPTTRLAY